MYLRWCILIHTDQVKNCGHNSMKVVNFTQIMVSCVCVMSLTYLYIN